MFRNGARLSPKELSSSLDNKSVPVLIERVNPSPYALYVKGLKNVLCAGCAWPPVPGMSMEAIAGFKEKLMEPVKLRGMEVLPIEVFSHMAYDMVQEQMRKWKAEGVPYNFGGTIIKVFGLKNGVKTTYTFSGVSRSMTTTPRTLASVSKMVAAGEVKARGAYAAEGCISPLDFMKAFTEGFATIKAMPGKEKNEFIVDIVPASPAAFHLSINTLLATGTGLVSTPSLFHFRCLLALTAEYVMLITY